LLHLPRMAPAPIGLASRNNSLQTNRNNGILSGQIAATRIWTINRTTGDVMWMRMVTKTASATRDSRPIH
jgi:hypothetical protein